MQNQRAELMGKAAALNDRFPLLIKILDAEEKLSLQVHPPASKAAAMGGEPKTEMWYIAQARNDAELYVGLRKNVSRAEFEFGIRDGTVAKCFHRVHVNKGDAMFLPSGRVHAIGAGLVIFEIQQNSDTTFRVHDWNRVGLDGKPRELHIAESLDSIDFEDVEPPLIRPRTIEAGAFVVRSLVNHPLMRIDLVEAGESAEFQPGESRVHVVAAIGGSLVVRGGGVSAPLQSGGFCLIPANVADATLQASAGARFLI